MDNFRLILTLALAYTGFLIWQAWQHDYGPKPAVSVSQVQTASDSVPSATADTPSVATGAVPNASVAPTSRVVRVTTDMFDLDIDLQGGSLTRAFLQKYSVAVDQPNEKFHLLSNSADNYFIVQSGLLAAQGTDAPNHQTLFTTAADSYQMADDAMQLAVDLNWDNGSGLKVTKRYIFTRGSHLVQVQHLVDNQGQSAWTGRDYRQLQRGEPTKGTNAFMYTYTGGVAYSPEEKYQKYDFKDLAAKKLERDVTGGWVAMIQHYFLGAFVPPADEKQHQYSKGLEQGRGLIGTYSETVSVAPGNSHAFKGGLYLGPKLQADLEAIAPGLDLTVDYGWLTMIAKPMYLILDWINKLVSNWGWTIIIFTILIKGAFFKLSETGYRSMAQMRTLTPRIQALKDRYGDDRERLQAAMMEMYKKEKINPMGGCLPILIQMPFFIALYWVLMESVELRQAPWIMWINDLSVQDPYFVLPVLMGISMFVMQKLQPEPPDPMQAKMMMALPFVFTVMFAFFPSGLVLYWVVNNVLSAAQQYVITKRMEALAK